MEELRECPGCGGTRVATELWGDWFITECQECRQWQTGFHSNENDSKKSWNTRASDAAIKELVDGLTKLRSVFSGAPFNDFNISICHNIDKLISTATGIK